MSPPLLFTIVEDCRRDQAAIGYLGNISVAVSGRRCLPWSKVARNQFIYDSDFPDGSVGAARDYCRNIHRDDQGPWCFTEGSVMEYCNISYCGELKCYSCADVSLTDSCQCIRNCFT